MYLSIHEEIGKCPDSRSIGRLISIISKYNDLYLREELREYSLVGTHYLILRLIYEKKKITQDQLISLFDVDKAQMSRLLNSLAEKKYITKNINPEDRRSYYIILTETGRTLCTSTHELLSNLSDKLLDGFTKEEKKTVFIYLDRIFLNAAILCNKKVVNEHIPK